MDPYRTNRLNQSILEVLSDLLQTAVKDPRVGFVTLNSVKLNRDHSVAEVYWSILGEDDDRDTSFAGLKKARGFMQSKLTRTLGLRAAPNLRFIYDDSVEKSVALDTVLDGLAAQGEFLTEEEKRKQLTLDDLVVPPELLKGISEAQNIWIVPHFNPDPDAIGSALALCQGLQALGRDARVVSYPDPAVGLSDLPGYKQNVVTSDQAEELYERENPDTLLLVDCHRIDRTGPLEDFLDRFENRFCVDHHLVSGRKAPEAGWVEPRSCSTCTLVYRLLDVLGDGKSVPGEDAFSITLDMGTNIYAGLINDTGSFRFSNTLPFTFELARRLSELGVDTAQVARTTLNRYRPQGIDLLQRVLATFIYHADGQVLLATADRQMLEDSGGVMSDTEGFVNLATSVDGVRMVAFLKEIDDETWRVSLRVRGEGDVQQIAARHGGGGHKQAAGCTLTGSHDDVSAALAVELTAALD